MRNITAVEAVIHLGKKCHKFNSGKPFKSGEKVNTIRGVIIHPILNIPAYIFDEDDSFVECRRCVVIENDQ